MQFRLTLENGKQPAGLSEEAKVRTDEQTGEEYIDVDVTSPLLSAEDQSSVKRVSVKFEDARVLVPNHFEHESAKVFIEHDDHEVPTAARMGFGAKAFHSRVSISGPTVASVISAMQAIENKCTVVQTSSFVIDEEF